MRLALLLLGLLASASASASSISPSPETEARRRPKRTRAPTPPPTEPNRVAAETVARGLGFATSFTLRQHGGAVFFATPTAVKALPPGETNGSLAKTVWAAPPGFFAAVPGAGIMGVTMNRESFATNSVLFMYCANRQTPRGVRHQVWRFVVNTRTWAAAPGSLKLLWQSDASGDRENGGKLAVARNRLWFTVGDGNDVSGPAFAQNSSDLGKILSIPTTGAMSGGKLVAVRGIRNAFGLAFDPWARAADPTAGLWFTDPGPLDCEDELNKLTLRGGNAAWGPGWSCANLNPARTPGQAPVLPKITWPKDLSTASKRPPTPTGIAFCGPTCPLTNVTGTLVVGFYNGARLESIQLNDARDAVVASRFLYRNLAPIIAVETDVDGDIFFLDAAGAIKRVVNLLK